MSKFESMYIVVTLTDNEKIKSDIMDRERFLAELRKAYPRESESNLDSAVESTIEELKDTLSKINKLVKLTLMVEEQEMAINPSLVKYIRFFIEREK